MSKLDVITKEPTSFLVQVLNAIAYVSMAAWVVMALFVGTAIADHKLEPHASAATKEALNSVRMATASNEQSIIFNERFASAMRNQNTIDHTALNKLIVAQAVVIDKIWDRVK